MSVANLSTSTQNYLKVIWGLQEWSDTPVTTSLIAKQVNLTISTVSDAIRRLTEHGLVEHAPYGSVTLTEQGCAHALSMVRRHRLIETFLAQVLNYTWDEVHDEAEQLEHAVSDLMIDRVDAFLGHPTRDPHGDPIPTADGMPRRPDAMPLIAAAPGTRVKVERISDADADRLKYFATRGITIDAALEILEADPYSDAVVIQVGRVGTPISLGTAAANAIWVSNVK